MIPRWKIRREVFRVGKQILNLGKIIAAPFRRMHYDLFLRKKIKRVKGTAPIHRDMAILLIYQPDGLLESLIKELEHFSKNKISVVIVANHTIAHDDILRLKPLCYQIIQRPNVGYDFGGYREGVLTVLEEDLRPRNLFLTNDSIWFPLRPDCTLLQTALDSDADIYGIFYNTTNRNVSNWHLQSYFFRFNEKIVTDPRFEKIWRRLPLFQDKQLVIRRCEVKITGKLRAMGFTSDSLFTSKDIIEASLRLSNEELLRVARFHTSSSLRGNHIFSEIAQLSADDEDFRVKVEEKLKNTRFKFYFIDSHPLIFLKELNSPFIKKSREYHYLLQRKEIAANNLLEKCEPTVREELLNWDADGKSLPSESSEFPELQERWFS